MNELLDIITNKQPNIYQFKEDLSYQDLLGLCQNNSCQLFYLEGKNITDKNAFFEVCVAAMNLPEYFGNNWDGWEECLTDLSWCSASGYIFYYHNSQFFAESSPDDWAILLDILQEAIAYWQLQNIRFSVVLA
jgi:RNAse (barnase) inhibitor barstar